MLCLHTVPSAVRPVVQTSDEDTKESQYYYMTEQWWQHNTTFITINHKAAERQLAFSWQQRDWHGAMRQSLSVRFKTNLLLCSCSLPYNAPAKRHCSHPATWPSNSLPFLKSHCQLAPAKINIRQPGWILHTNSQLQGSIGKSTSTMSWCHTIQWEMGPMAAALMGHSFRIIYLNCCLPILRVSVLFHLMVRLMCCQEESFIYLMTDFWGLHSSCALIFVALPAYLLYYKMYFTWNTKKATSLNINVGVPSVYRNLSQTWNILYTELEE